MYKQAMSLASNIDEKKTVLSALSNAESYEALEMAAEYLDDKSLQNEAMAAVVRLAPETMAEHRRATRRLLRKVINLSPSEYIRERAEEILEDDD
jgi:hypothetical protein